MIRKLFYISILLLVVNLVFINPEKVYGEFNYSLGISGFNSGVTEISVGLSYVF